MTANEFSACCECLFERIRNRKPEQFGFRIKLDNDSIVQFYPDSKSNYQNYFIRESYYSVEKDGRNDLCYIHVIIHDNSKKETEDYFIPASIIKYISVVYPDKEDKKQQNYISW